MNYFIFLGFLLITTSSSFASEMIRKAPSHLTLTENKISWINPISETFFFVDNITDENSNFPEDIKGIIKSNFIILTDADIQTTSLPNKHLFSRSYWFMNFTKETKKTMTSLNITDSLYKRKTAEEHIDFFIMDNEESYNSIMALPINAKTHLARMHGFSCFFKSKLPKPKLAITPSFPYSIQAAGAIGLLATTGITRPIIPILLENEYCSAFAQAAILGSSLYVGYELALNYFPATVREELINNNYIERPFMPRKNNKK